MVRVRYSIKIKNLKTNGICEAYLYKTVFQHFRKFSNKTNGPVMRIAGAKAELPQVSIFFSPLKFLPWEFLLIKKVGNQKN